MRIFMPWRWREMQRERIEFIADELASVTSFIGLVRQHPEIVCRPAPPNAVSDGGVIAAYIAYRQHNDGSEWRCVRCDHVASAAIAVTRVVGNAPPRATFLLDLCDYCARIVHVVMESSGEGVDIT